MFANAGEYGEHIALAGEAPDGSDADGLLAGTTSASLLQSMEHVGWDVGGSGWASDGVASLYGDIEPPRLGLVP